jgi:hypothetical protein
LVDTLSTSLAITLREQLFLARGARYPSDVSTVPDKRSAISAAAAAFEATGTRYALIGGLAVGVRSGVPRATLDVDFAIPSGVDRKDLATELVRRGFRLTGEFAHSINFEHESGEPVQLAFDEAFDPMIERAEAVQLGQLWLPVVTKDDLIAMKRMAAADPKRRRSKALRDQADIALLEGDVPEPGEGW